MDSAIFDKAQAILLNRRKKAESENEVRIEEINQKLPQVKEINDALFNTGKEIISIILNGKGEDVSGKVEKLKQDNLGAQEMLRKILVENGYPEDYLDVHYTCPICCDRGYNKSSYCECFKSLCGKLAADELNKSSQLKLSNFDNFLLSYYSGEDYYAMKSILEYTKQYAFTFSTSSKSLFMFGQTGLGKTHLSLAIANHVLKKGYSVIYDSTINILRNIEKEHFSYEHSSDMIDLVMNTDLLILDDLGTEYESSFYNATIYNIVNTRLNRSKPTIISTNLNFNSFEKRYDTRVSSRIFSTYACLEFKGNDIRRQIRKNNV